MRKSAVNSNQNILREHFTGMAIRYDELRHQIAFVEWAVGGKRHHSQYHEPGRHPIATAAGHQGIGHSCGCLFLRWHCFRRIGSCQTSPPTLGCRSGLKRWNCIGLDSGESVGWPANCTSSWGSMSSGPGVCPTVGREHAGSIFANPDLLWTH
jgi:hypothetical protein